jgi:hypothetical protein
MLRSKRIVAGAVVFVILLSFVLYVVIVRRSQADQERHARTAVARWYRDHGHSAARVTGCRLVDLGKVIDGFSCTVAGSCPGAHVFIVPAKGHVKPYARETGC